MQPTQNLWPKSSSATQNQYKTSQNFRFMQILILTVIFAILVGHIELKKLTEKLVCNPIQCHTLKNIILGRTDEIFKIIEMLKKWCHYIQKDNKR